jgi:kynurenine formamidase
LLGNNIPIAEHLCGLATVPASGARFFAVPVKVKAFGTFPVRAFAKVEEEFLTSAVLSDRYPETARGRP